MRFNAWKVFSCMPKGPQPEVNAAHLATVTLSRGKAKSNELRTATPLAAKHAALVSKICCSWVAARHLLKSALENGTEARMAGGKEHLWMPAELIKKAWLQKAMALTQHLRKPPELLGNASQLPPLRQTAAEAYIVKNTSRPCPALRAHA